MKDQQVIKRLQLLKTLQPTKHTLLSMKESVYQQIQSETKALPMQDKFRNTPTQIISYGITFYAGAVAFLLILFLSASILLFPAQTQNVLLYGRLSFAPNQYEKARIALEDTKSRFAGNTSGQKNTNELAYSLSLTNSQLNSLKLKGEKGKYTAQECHQIYHEYLSYLEIKEKNISSNNNALKGEIKSYEEQAERKLHMYNSL